MIKGINHSIIEVNETGSAYYERALLFIRPEYASVQRTLLEEEAKKMLRGMDIPSSIRNRKNLWKKILTGICLTTAGLLLGILLVSGR